MRGFFHAEADKPAQLHHTGCARIDFLEPLQGLIQRQKVSGLRGCQVEIVIDLNVNLSPAAFLGKIRPRVVDQDAPHRLGGDREEMRPILPVAIRLRDQAKVGFVHKRRRLQRMARTLLVHEMGRPAAEFTVNHRHQPRHGVRASGPEFQQKMGDVFVRRGPPKFFRISHLKIVADFLTVCGGGFRLFGQIQLILDTQC